MFESLLVFGLVGLVVMCLMGFVYAHGGHAGASHGIDSSSHPGLVVSHLHGHVGAHVATPGAVHHGHTVGQGHGAVHHGHGTGHGVGHAALRGLEMAKSIAWMAISPLDIFSLAFGMGVVGKLLKHTVVGSPLIYAAIVGGLIFDLLIVRTALSFAMRFAGAPSEGLEGAPGHEATASTGFDRSGKGVVTLVLDGQQVQVLASLESDELKRGVRVGKGDRVILTSVDAARNRCSVSKELGE